MFLFVGLFEQWIMHTGGCLILFGGASVRAVARTVTIVSYSSSETRRLNLIKKRMT